MLKRRFAGPAVETPPPSHGSDQLSQAQQDAADSARALPIHCVPPTHGPVLFSRLAIRKRFRTTSTASFVRVKSSQVNVDQPGEPPFGTDASLVYLVKCFCLVSNTSYWPSCSACPQIRPGRSSWSNFCARTATSSPCCELAPGTPPTHSARASKRNWTTFTTTISTCLLSSAWPRTRAWRITTSKKGFASPALPFRFSPRLTR